MKKTVNYILLLMVFLCLSCAHKSGHKERNRVSYSNSNPVRSSRTDTRAEIGSSRRGNKMDGSEVFRKYNNAVFIFMSPNDISKLENDLEDILKNKE